MIKIQNLNFGYRKAWPVFENFSLELPEGKVYGLLGKNGTGKSTLLYLVSGLLRPWSGTVETDGYEARERRPEMLSEVMLVPEEYDLPAISLERYVKINAPFYPNFSRELLEGNLREFELGGDINLGRLSMGQKKKVIISFALAAGTKYLLMDEPTNGLDIPSKAQFRKVVAASMTEGRTVIISTHQVRDVDTLIDHVVIINNREVLINSSLDALASSYRFEIRQSGAPADDVIYAEPSLQGNYVIARGQGSGDNSFVNLELLFNAVTVGALNVQQ
ncbi:MAG: ATP-binding cassette domain-containing protein [Bacteroidaceae bacterium]|nr:ATP-binding cassette domain-containing protein [Bacteroidaceae bacterium]